MTKRKIGSACGTALLIAAVVVVAMREQRPAPWPEAPGAQTPAAERVKAVERNVETLDFSNAEAALKFLKLAPRHTSTEFGILSPETA